MIFEQDLYLVPDYAKSHAVLMSTAFIVVFPLGAWNARLIQSSRKLWIHTTIQLFGWFTMLAGLGLGIRLGNILDRLENNAHTVLGTIVVVLLILQPFIGLIQHVKYLGKERKTIWNTIHKWYGGMLILLGMINGGLGLQLANNTTGGKLAYGVLAGISGLAFASLLLWQGPGSSQKAGQSSDIAMLNRNVDDLKANGAE